ncbi:diacylglycerol/lipid kinase family protein [Zobellia alginiliquefaciens]|uniref:diacylglycerol/lipid kinase family protein n=1 Tax=Zobellia alginiliquefaciens TaxID=3032586 RepID=UPI0023E1C8B4|nr:diacylglycerol kinase family protein [Zobellia alginiliquefaciens]
MEKVLLIVNPVSGNRDKEPLIQKVRDYLGPKSDFSLYRTTGKDDRSELRSKIKKTQPDRIVVLGGDGTIKLTTEVCLDNNILVGILPAGSANGLATDLKLPMNIDEALPIAFGSKSSYVDALNINGEIGLHMSDIGINAELIANYSESRVRGHFGYFIKSIPTLLQTEAPYTFEIEVNQEQLQVDAIMVAFANSRKYGTGAVINPNGNIDDGKFELIIFKKFDVLEIIKTLQGEHSLGSDFANIIPTTKATVKMKKPLDFQIDGEHYGKTKQVTIKIEHQAIQIAIGS